jgi:FG-GAP-like repeat
VFADVTAKSSIRFKQESSRTSQKYLPESMGGGVAMLDYNNDGHLDLFFVNGAQMQDPMPRGASPDKSNPRYWTRFYRNSGDGTFTDVTEAAGVQGHSYGMEWRPGIVTALLRTLLPRLEWAGADGAQAPASLITIAMAASTWS